MDLFQTVCREEKMHTFVDLVFTDERLETMHRLCHKGFNCISGYLAELLHCKLWQLLSFEIKFHLCGLSLQKEGLTFSSPSPIKLSK